MEGFANKEPQKIASGMLQTTIGKSISTSMDFRAFESLQTAELAAQCVACPIRWRVPAGGAVLYVRIAGLFSVFRGITMARGWFVRPAGEC